MEFTVGTQVLGTGVVGPRGTVVEVELGVFGVGVG